jgi:hypothetical protein
LTNAGVSRRSIADIRWRATKLLPAFSPLVQSISRSSVTRSSRARPPAEERRKIALAVRDVGAGSRPAGSFG